MHCIIIGALDKNLEWMMPVINNHIAGQNASDEKKNAYDEFVQECWNKIYVIIPNEKILQSYQYLVWGSYNRMLVKNY